MAVSATASVAAVPRMVLVLLVLLGLAAAFSPPKMSIEGGPGSPAMVPLRQTPPRRIGLMVEPTPFTHVSGYSNRFNEMLKYLSKAGDDVQIVTPDQSPDAPKKKFGFGIHTIKGFICPFYEGLALAFDVRQESVKIFNRFKPELMHVSSPGFLVFIALIMRRMFKVPLVFSYHTHLPMYARNYCKLGPIRVPFAEKFAWFLLNFVHNKADLTLATSPQMQEELSAKGIKRVSVWRKGIDTEVFNPKFKDPEMRSRLTNGNPDSPLLLYVGRLGAEKRLSDLKEVMEKLPSNTRLAFVGKGPAAQELEEETFADPALKERVVFTGLLRGEELSKAFASADIFCMPSDSETLGFVVLESMASGVPVVAARAGGIPNLIEHGKTGFLIQPKNTDEFAAQIKELIENPERREKIALASRVEAEKWGWEASVSDLRNVQYKQAITNFQERASARAFDGAPATPSLA